MRDGRGTRPQPQSLVECKSSFLPPLPLLLPQADSKGRCSSCFLLFYLFIYLLQYLNLESSFEGKDYVCDRLLQFLQGEASSGTSEKLSFQLMEALLYRVHLNYFTGRIESALAILRVSDCLCGKNILISSATHCEIRP